MKKLFETMSDSVQKVTAALLMGMGCVVFSGYIEPTVGAWLPRIFYGPLKFIFDEVHVIHYAGMLGTMMAIPFVAILALRGFITGVNKTLIGIITLAVDVYGIGLLFDIVFGDTSKFLQGGLSTMLALAAYALSILGMRQYVPLAMIGLGVMCIGNIIAAESMLVLPGSLGIILMFLSVFLQCDDFFGKLGEVTQSIRGK